jgi:hypothetical protein
MMLSRSLSAQRDHAEWGASAARGPTVALKPDSNGKTNTRQLKPERRRPILGPFPEQWVRFSDQEMS